MPQRSCIACRRVRPKQELIRVVRAPTGEVALDSRGKLSGRGAYVCPAVECWQEAVKAKRLERALGVSIPEALGAQMESEIKRRAGAGDMSG